jgi:hypothetical protein
LFARLILGCGFCSTNLKLDGDILSMSTLHAYIAN